MKITISEARETDIPGLFEMNKRLMEDERFDRPLDDERLMERWHSFFDKEKYKVLLFRLEQDVAGYAVLHINQEPLYLRHFFIDRQYRRKGLGTECFGRMMEYMNAGKMDLDVMYWNERGYAFWKSLGFTERCIMMSLER